MPSPEIVGAVVNVQVPAEVHGDHAADLSGQQDLLDLLVARGIAIVERTVVIPV
jgi:hypothetical protein